MSDFFVALWEYITKGSVAQPVFLSFGDQVLSTTVLFIIIATIVSFLMAISIKTGTWSFDPNSKLPHIIPTIGAAVCTGLLVYGLTSHSGGVLTDTTRKGCQRTYAEVLELTKRYNAYQCDTGHSKNPGYCSEIGWIVKDPFGIKFTGELFMKQKQCNKLKDPNKPDDWGYYPTWRDAIIQYVDCRELALELEILMKHKEEAERDPSFCVSSNNISDQEREWIKHAMHTKFPGYYDWVKNGRDGTPPKDDAGLYEAPWMTGQRLIDSLEKINNANGKK